MSTAAVSTQARPLTTEEGIERWNFWIELLYAAGFIIYLYIAFYPVKNELLIIKLSKTSQFNKTRVALAYWSIVVPSLFVSTAIALLFI